jgi:hypothetical protein
MIVVPNILKRRSQRSSASASLPLSSDSKSEGIAALVFTPYSLRQHTKGFVVGVEVFAKDWSSDVLRFCA